MKVSLRMTSDPIVVTPEHSYAATAKLMKEHNIRRVPVIDKNGKLVGLVSQTDILSVSPSPATSLSIYEITTLLDELKIKQIMKKPVFVVESTCDLASAAKFMLEKKIGALPIMEGDKLVGIITETDIFKAMSEAMGADEPGHRLELTVEDQKGMLAKICAEVAKAGGNIASLATLPGSTGKILVSILEEGADANQLRSALMALEDCELVDMHPAGKDQLRSFA